MIQRIPNVALLSVAIWFKPNRALELYGEGVDRCRRQKTIVAGDCCPHTPVGGLRPPTNPQEPARSALVAGAPLVRAIRSFDDSILPLAAQWLAPGVCSTLKEMKMTTDRLREHRRRLQLLEVKRRRRTTTVAAAEEVS